MSTRSTTNLQTGDIHDFLLPEVPRRNRTCSVSETEAGGNVAEVRDNTEETQEDTDNSTMSETTTEYQQLMSILGKVAENLNTMAIAQNDNNGGNVGARAQFQKLEDCPIKRKKVSLESWLREVELWDQCNKVDGNSYGKKYQKFIESIRNSEDAEEIISVANAEFIENVLFERSKEDTCLLYTSPSPRD